jgi:hypothetical protein
VIAFPVWIASGLLTPVVIGVVVGAPVQLLTGGGNPFTGDDVLAPWVFGLVYGGFTAQAVLLFTGFVLYACARWPMATGGGHRDRDVGGATTGLQRLLAGVFVLTAIGYAAVQLSTAVFGGGRFEEPQTSQRVLLVGSAALAVAGAGALARLVRDGRLTRSSLALAWLGSAVVFCDALSQTLATVAIEPGSWGAARVGAGQATLMLLALLGALCGGIGGALPLVEAEQAFHVSSGATRRADEQEDAGTDRQQPRCVDEQVARRHDGIEIVSSPVVDHGLCHGPAWTP